LDNNKNLFEQNKWDQTASYPSWVMSKFRQRVESFEWNKGKAVPIIAALHGTRMDKAWYICNGGFAALSTLDEGYYGRGIYLTSYAENAARYSVSNEPGIIIAWVLPCHPYPVVEHPRGENSLLGAPLKSQSHYVRTDMSGMVLSDEAKVSYDEIVINQESHICPAFVLTIKFVKPYQPPSKVKGEDREPAISPRTNDNEKGKEIVSDVIEE